jgi:hypothetical protein
MVKLNKTLHNLKIVFRERALEIFQGERGALPPQRSARKGNCLSAEGASFAFAAKRGGAGSKNVQRAEGS